MAILMEKLRKSGELSEKAIAEIEQAKKRIRKGDYLTEEEARKKLGF